MPCGARLVARLLPFILHTANDRSAAGVAFWRFLPSRLRILSDRGRVALRPSDVDRGSVHLHNIRQATCVGNSMNGESRGIPTCRRHDCKYAGTKCVLKVGKVFGVH